MISCPYVKCNKQLISVHYKTAMGRPSKLNISQEQCKYNEQRWVQNRVAQQCRRQNLAALAQDAKCMHHTRGTQQFVPKTLSTCVRFQHVYWFTTASLDNHFRMENGGIFCFMQVADFSIVNLRVRRTRLGLFLSERFLYIFPFCESAETHNIANIALNALAMLHSRQANRVQPPSHMDWTYNFSIIWTVMKYDCIPKSKEVWFICGTVLLAPEESYCIAQKA